MILIAAIPVFMLTMLLEWRLTQDKPVIGYRLKDSAANIAMGLGSLVFIFASKVVVLALYLALYEQRVFDLPTGAWWVVLLLFFADDFCFYWYHRVSHEVRLLWAAHVNHHSSTTYNLSTALRQPWTSQLFTWFFWMPLPFLGFHPLTIFVAQSINLLYQYWIHTELIDKMGAFGWVFNTPSHHRVHHGTHPRYLDRNYGGILIVWDRLFGTFEPEVVASDYGLTRNINSYNLLDVAFHEWRDMFQELRSARSWRGRTGAVLGPPGWREDGSGQTSQELREAFIAAEKQAS